MELSWKIAQTEKTPAAILTKTPAEIDISVLFKSVLFKSALCFRLDISRSVLEIRNLCVRLKTYAARFGKRRAVT